MLPAVAAPQKRPGEEALRPGSHAVENLILRHCVLAAGSGLLPLPLVDLAAITLVNLKLLRELAALYGVPYQAELARQSFSGLVGGLSTQLLIAGPVYSLLRLVPGVGWIVGGASIAGVAGGVTYATGRVFSQHFEKGGNFQNFSVASFRGSFKARAEAGAERVGAYGSSSIVEAVNIEVLPPDPTPPRLYEEPELNSVDAEEIVQKVPDPSHTRAETGSPGEAAEDKALTMPVEDQAVEELPFVAESTQAPAPAAPARWADLFPPNAEVEIDFGELEEEDITDERARAAS